MNKLILSLFAVVSIAAASPIADTHDIVGLRAIYAEIESSRQAVEAAAEEVDAAVRVIEDAKAALDDATARMSPAQASMTAAQQRLVDAQAALKAWAVGMDREPEPGGEPGTKPTDTLAILANTPFANRLPDLPEYTIPTRADCEWIIQDGRAVSQRGLASVAGVDDPGQLTFYVLAEAYRASIAAGHELPIDFGVVGNAGHLSMAAGWNSQPRRLTIPLEEGKYADLSLNIVGLSDDAEVQIGWGTQYGFVRSLGLYNIGIRAPKDSFAIRANDGIGTFIADGCWILNGTDPETGQMITHASGIHMDKWDVLVLRNFKWRGKTPEDIGFKCREHLFYLKSSRGLTWILDNNLMGGNRTGFQIRPGNDVAGSEMPRGPVVIAGNYAEGLDLAGNPSGYGWNNGETGETFDGGSCITVWSNPMAPTFIVGNRILDAKYGCLSVTGQPFGFGGVNRNWYNAHDRPHDDVFIYGNEFENMQRGRADNLPRRGAVSLSATTRLHLYGNDIDGTLTLDNEWSVRNAMDPSGQPGNQRNIAVTLYDPALVDREIRTYRNGRNEFLTRAEKQAMLAD